MSANEQTSSSPAVFQTLAWLRRNQFLPVPLHHQSKAAASRTYVEPGYSPPPDDHWRRSKLGVGVVLGPARGGPVDVDLDCDEALSIARTFFPPTQATFGRKSKPASHLLYQVNDPTFPKVAFTDPVTKTTLLELRADGGHQTVMPGSLHEDTGEDISWSDLVFPEVPKVDGDVLVKAAKRTAAACLVARHIWVEGGRNEANKHLAGMLFYLEWSVDEAEQFIQAVMDACDDTDRTRIKTLRATFAKGSNGGKITGSTTLRKFLQNDVVVDKLLEWIGNTHNNVLQEYNEKFACVKVGGKFRVVLTDVPPSESPEFMQVEDFTSFYGTDRVDIEGKHVPKTSLWLASDRRRSYSKVGFHPGKDDSDVLNIWTGWAVQPAEGDCSAWLELLRTTICGGDQALCNWMLNWFANLVKEPMRKPMTAPVLIGDQGAGKSLLIQYFGRILGRAYLTVTDERHVSGNFNQHTANALLLHSEEAVFGGDKKHRSNIKSMITDHSRIIEPKGVNSYPIDNYVRVIFTSNEDNAAPAERGDRRFTVIHMGNRRAPEELIDRVIAEMNGSGPAALHKFLCDFDYDFDVCKVNVKNEALAQLKAQNMDPVDRFWMDTLMRGEILPSDLKWASKPMEPWPAQVSSSALFMAFRFYVQSNRLRVTPNDVTFAAQVKRWLGNRKFDKKQKKYVNPYVGSDEPVHRDIRNLSDLQNSYLNFPTLEECRKMFEDYHGYAIEWPAEDDEIHHIPTY